MIERGGRKYVLFAGLLDEAHQKGLRGIDTELIQVPEPENGNVAVVKAVVEMEDGRTFSGIGDASPENVGRNIVPHLTRMAETRSKARALRDAVNVGVTALEELSDDGDDPASASRSSTGPRRGSERAGRTTVAGEIVDEQKPSQKISGSSGDNAAGVLATDQQIKAINKLAEELGGDDSTAILAWVEKEYGNPAEMLTDSEAGDVIQRLNKRKAAGRNRGKG
jgi:hypothetical protein